MQRPVLRRLQLYDCSPDRSHTTARPGRSSSEVGFAGRLDHGVIAVLPDQQVGRPPDINVGNHRRWIGEPKK